MAQHLADPAIARWVRNQWLHISETRLSCRNIGLILEALRPKDELYDFILEFYEAYDYFAARHPSGKGPRKRFWPVLEETENLLRVAGDSEAAIRINRRGNEYFLKFRPLVEIIRQEKRKPVEFTKLTNYFILQGINPLLRYTTNSGGQPLDLGKVTYESEEAAH